MRNNPQYQKYYQLIRNYISQFHFEAALVTVSRLLAEFPTCEWGYYYMGVCNYALRNYDDAIANYSQAIKIKPSFAKAYFNLGVLCFVINRMDDALVNIGKALMIFSRKRDYAGKKRSIEALKLILKERNL